MAADYPILYVFTMPEVVTLVPPVVFPHGGGSRGSKEVPAI